MEFVHRPYIEGETIAAIATPTGEGGISIIRVSGKEAILLASKLFSGPVSTYVSHTAHLGKIHDTQGNVIDEVLLLIMRAPRSFTGEDTVEIHCHGGAIVTRKILSLVLEAGARIANPGEFSFKAFMNSKIDLAQAEAIQEVISAKNDLSFHAAEAHLQGALSEKIRGLQKQLLDIAAILNAWVDFPEEGLEFASKEDLLRDLSTIIGSMEHLLDSFHEGKIIHDGLSLCLTGPPNAGKSSLMNALLGKDRAIVTDIAGTTRDLLEDNLSLGGLHFRLIDTAGIRETEEIIEKEGIRRSKEAMQKADIVILVLDASKDLSPESLALLSVVPKEKTLLAWNKMDLPSSTIKESGLAYVALSALKGNGIQELKEKIAQLIWKKGPPSKEEVILTNLRHKQALEAAIGPLLLVKEGLETDVSPEFLSFDIRKCLFELGTILGLNVSEEILSAIFSKFCVGK